MPDWPDKTGISTINRTLIIYGIVLAVAVLVWAPSGTGAQDEPSAVKKSEELESVRDRIRVLENDIQAAQDRADRLQKDIQANERDAVRVRARLTEIEGEINARVQKLASLNVDKAEREKSLADERNILAQQIRATYKTGRNDYLKLLLNQEDPELVGRMLVYYNYYNRARSDRIDKINNSLHEIGLIQENIRTQKLKLDGLRGEQLKKLEEFTRSRTSRNENIQRLQAYIGDQGKRLQVLQRNEQELEALVNELRRQESIVKSFEEVPPFTTLKGKLKWPVAGKIGAHYGTPRKGGKLKWQGVLIRAGNGAEVHAVSTGKVVFADWFRNLGLLIIVDHGNGYLSLYGHNEQLLKKVGDWVRADETIARAGDTGGLQQPGLYFEIRAAGAPVNPALWCKP